MNRVASTFETTQRAAKLAGSALAKGSGSSHSFHRHRWRALEIFTLVHGSPKRRTGDEDVFMVRVNESRSGQMRISLTILSLISVETLWRIESWGFEREMSRAERRGGSWTWWWWW